jgi:hypothetical protein
MRKLPENGERAICGAAIHDDVLDVRVILARNAFERFPDGVFTVKGRGDNGDLYGCAHFL